MSEHGSKRVRRPSRPLLGISIALVAVIVGVAACSKPLGTPVAAVRDTLISYAAETGTWKPVDGGYELTMEQVDQVTEITTGGKRGRHEKIRTSTLIGQWSEIFGGNDPTAVVVLTLEDGNTLSVVVILSDPVLDGADVTYRAQPTGESTAALARLRADARAKLPASFGRHKVVIDGSGANLPPATTPPAPTTAPPTTAPAPGPTVPPCSTPGSVGTDPLKLSIVNTSATTDDQVFVTLTGAAATGYASWTSNPTNLVNTSVPLSCLPRDPDVPGGHAYMVEVSEGVASGLLWVSYGAGLPGLPTTQPSFDTSMTRFANVEFAYPGQGDMTNVDQFSFPVNLDTYASPTASPSDPAAESSHYNATTCEIVGALKDTVDAQGANASWNQVVVKDGGSNFVRVVSPKQRAQQPAMSGGKPNPFAQGWPSLSGYLASMANTTVTVSGLFSPGTGSDYLSQAGWYQYTATFDADSNVTLTGTIQAPLDTKPGGKGSVTGQSMSIQSSGPTGGNPNNLLTGMYDQSSAYAVAGASRNGSADGVTPNDVYNTIYRDFVTAFTYGYWGGRYGSSNTGFWQSFDPPSAPTGGQPSFEAARNGKDAFTAFNVYAQTMFNYSNNYNIPYGEDYGSGAPGRQSPLLDLPLGGTFRATIGSDGPSGCLGTF